MMSIYSSGWAEDSLDSSVETASFKVAICLKRNSKIVGYGEFNEICISKGNLFKGIDNKHIWMQGLMIQNWGL